MKYKNSNLSFKKPFWVILLFFLTGANMHAQWVGSSEPETRSRIQTTPENNTNQRKGLAHIGIGFGGITKNLVDDARYLYTGYFSGNNYLMDVKYDKSSSVNAIIGGVFSTSYPQIHIGYELGLGYASKDVSYTYTDLWGLYDATGKIKSYHFGGAVLTRYNFIKNKDFDLYGQASIGYGIVSLHDDHENDLLTSNDSEIQGTFYGGGAVGVRLALFFMELGYQSTGYLRIGLSIF